jgi:hypothetical protein
MVDVGLAADVSAMAVRISSSEGGGGEFVHPKRVTTIMKGNRRIVNLCLLITYSCPTGLLL